MLATDPARRGHGLSLILGAHDLLDMETRFGFQAFMTGVEPGNAPSEAVCARAGMSPGNDAIIACTDPHALASGRMTKWVLGVRARIRQTSSQEMLFGLPS